MKHAYAQSPGLVLAALGPGEGLGEQLRRLLDVYEADAAVVATAIGSLDQLAFTTAQLGPGGSASYAAPTRLNGALEIAALQGNLGRNEDGLPELHLHGTFVCSDGSVVAGHFIEGRVLVTVEIGLLLGAGVRWLRTRCATANGATLPIFDPQCCAPQYSSREAQ